MCANILTETEVHLKIILFNVCDLKFMSLDQLNNRNIISTFLFSSSSD